ncbi:hypothetical protein Tco_0370370 [Tanacetum coccineum]
MLRILRLEKGSIKATRQKVHDMLGIPMGSKKLEDLEHRPSNDPFIKEWEEQPALRRWKTTTMKKRIKMETKTRCLGKLEHHGEFDPEEEKDGMNVYKGLDVYVPLINDKEPETKELVRTLKNGVKKFEDDHIMIDFCKKYGELLNDNEFNLYESSKDDDSEGEPDEDNESNNHDDDGAPMADANKQKESDNQKKDQNKEEIDNQTEESGSEGTEESGIQMDIDNQNEELNKEKDANETKDNDIVNNNEMKNDSVQEKQDVDKDENAEKEKVKTEKEKQDKADKVDNTKDMFKWKKEDGKKYDEVKQYKAFSDIMKNEFKKDDELKKMKDLEMKNMFSMHLKEVQHPRAKDVLNKKPTILIPKWGTKENDRLWCFLDDAHGELQRRDCKELEP